MQINIEKRNGDYYVITEEKYKNDNIVINLSSVIKTDDVWIQQNISTKKIEIAWALRYDDSTNKLYIDLIADDQEPQDTTSFTYTKEIDLINLTMELVECVKNNSIIENCKLLNKAMNELYNEFFRDYLGKDILVFSNNILTGNCIIKLENKVLGNASRFMLQSNNINILEYVGKTLYGHNSLKIYIYIENKKIEILTSKAHENNSFYDPNEHLLAYYSFGSIYLSNTFENLEDIPSFNEYHELNVPYCLSTPKNMYKYITENNTTDDILRYRISLKPVIKLININKFMINEYSR